MQPFKSQANGELALRVANWLASHGYACALRETDDGVVTITYGDTFGEIWPSIRVNAGTITWPKNSPEDLMFAFLEA